MRGYMQLLDFMRELGDGIQDHLPEEQRTSVLTLDEIVTSWVDGKTYLQIRSLEKDIASFLKKDKAEDYSVYEILSWYDLLFIHERFGCEEPELLITVLPMIKRRVVEGKRSIFDDFKRWLTRKWEAQGWG